MTGSGGKCSLYSKEGLCLLEVAQKDHWVWASAYDSVSSRAALGTEDGRIEVKQINYGLVYALSGDKYAYQENLTEIIIHSLSTDKKVRIKCKDLIRRVALYKNKLAIQLSDRVCVYESSADDSNDLHYHLRRERISITDKSTTNMLITASHLLFFRDSNIELYSFDCARQRTWRLDSPCSCARVDGGPEGREAVVLACESGSLFKLFVDNPFLLELGKRSGPVVLADINASRSKLVTIDKLKNLVVSDLKSQQVLHTASNVLFACFNTDIDDMLCYSINDTHAQIVSVAEQRAKESAFSRGQASQQSSQSYELLIPAKLMGFQGQKLYCQDKGNMVSVDVPQSNNIYKSVGQGDFLGAYKVACLGATESDWRLLGVKALRANALQVAKKSFAKLKDIRYLTLLDQILKSGPTSTQGATNRKGTNTLGDGALDPAWQAELLAYEGFHLEAAKMYTRAGRSDDALRILTDLRKWEDAKLFAQSAGYDANYQAELQSQQALWLHETNDWRGAAELYISLGQQLKGVTIVGETAETGWETFLIDVVRRTPLETGLETLAYCAEKFDQANKYELAKETYMKLGDMTRLMALYIRKKMWPEAAALAESNSGQFDASVFQPYADWLVSEYRYEEAFDAYAKAGRKDLGVKILAELLSNCTRENRFKDAAFYAWTISKDCDTDDDAREWRVKADLYYAYSTIHSFITDPFTSYQSETLFQISRFVLNSLGLLKTVPKGISEASTLYTLGKEAMTLSTYKLARQVYDKLSKLQLPPRKIDEIELNMLIVQAKPVRDDPDQLPVCYRCSSTNPLLNPFTDRFAGDVCTNCGHPFVRSFINFDVLPLVEFTPQDGISDDEAIDLIRQPPARAGAKGKSESKWSEERDATADRLTLSSDEGDSHQGGYQLADDGPDDDLFTRCLNRTLDKQVRTIPFLATFMPFI